MANVKVTAVSGAAVPIADTETPGIASFDSKDFRITSDGHVFTMQKAGAIQYFGEIVNEEDSAQADYFEWVVNEDISPKRLLDAVRGDLIGNYKTIITEEYDDKLDEGYFAGEVYVVESLVDGKIRTSREMLCTFQGQAGCIAIGTTYTVAYDEDEDGNPIGAKVENVGDKNNAILQFTLPCGKPPILKDTVLTDPGSNPEVTDDGSTKSTTYLTFKLPKPDTLNAGTASRTTYGNDPVVSNSGTEYEAVFDFEIPDGKPATLTLGDVNIVSCDEQPRVEMRSTGEPYGNDYYIDFWLPEACITSVNIDTDIDVLAPGSVPTVENIGTDRDAIIHFGLPASPTVEIDEDVTVLDPGEEPTVENLGNEYAASIHFSLPIAPSIDVTEAKVLDPGEEPTVENVGDNRNIQLEFSLPITPTIDVADTIILDAGEDAKVENIGDNRNIELQFSIPRGADGASFDVTGHADSVENLPEASKDLVGAVYAVGEEEPYVVYSCILNDDGTYSWLCMGEVQGPKGDTGTMTVGTVTTIEAGTDASIENVGTDTAAVLDFYLPGSPTIAVAEVESTDYETGASVENLGTPYDVQLKFVIPRGVDGANMTITGYADTYEDLPEACEELLGKAYAVGEKEPYDVYSCIDNGDGTYSWLALGDIRGPEGAAATVEVGTVTTLEPGSIPTVENSGDEHFAVLDFGLPTTPVVSVSETETLEAGNDAKVENVGDIANVDLKFSIPGSPTVNVDSVETVDYEESAKVENIGTEYDVKLKFSIPRGLDGAGYEVESHVESTSDLPEASADLVGTSVAVGDSEPYDIYTCIDNGDGTYSWLLMGQIRGPKGDSVVDAYLENGDLILVIEEMS